MVPFRDESRTAVKDDVSGSDSNRRGTLRVANRLSRGWDRVVDNQRLYEPAGH